MPEVPFTRMESDIPTTRSWTIGGRGRRRSKLQRRLSERRERVVDRQVLNDGEHDLDYSSVRVKSKSPLKYHKLQLPPRGQRRSREPHRPKTSPGKDSLRVEAITMPSLFFATDDDVYHLVKTVSKKEELLKNKEALKTQVGVTSSTATTRSSDEGRDDDVGILLHTDGRQTKPTSSTFDAPTSKSRESLNNALAMTTRLMAKGRFKNSTRKDGKRSSTPIEAQATNAQLGAIRENRRDAALSATPTVSTLADTAAAACTVGRAKTLPLLQGFKGQEHSVSAVDPVVNDPHGTTRHRQEQQEQKVTKIVEPAGPSPNSQCKEMVERVELMFVEDGKGKSFIRILMCANPDNRSSSTGKSMPRLPPPSPTVSSSPLFFRMRGKSPLGTRSVKRSMQNGSKGTKTDEGLVAGRHQKDTTTRGRSKSLLRTFSGMRSKRGVVPNNKMGNTKKSSEMPASGGQVILRPADDDSSRLPNSDKYVSNHMVGTKYWIFGLYNMRVLAH